jgi:hypothetical protein
VNDYDARNVRYVLRDLGLRKAKHGNGTDHELWITPNSLKVSPLLCRSRLSHQSVYALGTHLEQIGVIKRRDFISRIKQGRKGYGKETKANE